MVLINVFHSAIQFVVKAKTYLFKFNLMQNQVLFVVGSHSDSPAVSRCTDGALIYTSVVRLPLLTAKKMMPTSGQEPNGYTELGVLLQRPDGCFCQYLVNAEGEDWLIVSVHFCLYPHT